MELKCLASSSLGNCYVLILERGGGRKPYSLMVECGLPYKTIVRRLTQNGIAIADIGSCLITHSHGDHSQSAKDLSARGIAIHATLPTLKALGVVGFDMRYGKPYMIAEGVYVMPFKVHHDAEGSAGYIIKTSVETVIFAIDSAYWEQDVKAIKADYVFIEANYSKKIMDIEQLSLMKRGTVDDMIRYRKNQRVLTYHSSFEGTMLQLGKCDLSKCKAIFLTHLSDRMSNATLWKNVVKEGFGKPCFVCGKNGGVD